MQKLRQAFFVCSLVASVLASSAGALTLPTGFGDSLVASGLSSPTAMTIAPDGRIFVCQQSGALRVIENGTLLATPFATVTTVANGERGLLGVALHPTFPSPAYVYVYYTVSSPAPHNRVSRFTAAAGGNVAVTGSEVVLVELDNLTSATNHNGGAIHFGPDGKLYVAVGENATPSNAQTLANRLGKILRYEPDGTIPTDNPFFSSAAGANRAIWALGLRNPFTFGFEPGTTRMFVNDVGQNTWEEVDDGIAGSNYGWPTCEGACQPANPSFRDPLHQYSHADGCAIAGAAFYRPPVQQFPASYVGSYFFADLCGGWIRRLDPANGNAVTGFATGLSSPVDLRVGPDGILYALEFGTGSVRAIQHTQAPAITQHPANRTVFVGDTATFSVSASGAPPLAYQWKRNGAPIGGATQASYTTPPVSAADHGAGFRCEVSNSFGTTESNVATLSVTTNTPPVPAITAPTSRIRYRAGSSLSFSGRASDAEDGVLPASAFSWTIVFHHDTHTHPFAGPIDDVTSGSVVIPDRGETATNVFYRIHLTVTDSAGASASTFFDVLPQTVLLQLQSTPAGLQLTLDGQPLTSPISFQSVVGMRRTIGAPSPQTLGTTTYGFRNWSDRGAQTHEIVTPARGKRYTARYGTGTR